MTDKNATILDEAEIWDWPEYVIRDNFNLFRAELTPEVIERLEKIKEEQYR